MVGDQSSQNTQNGRRQVASRTTIPLARRAEQLGITATSLRRYVNLGNVSGTVSRVGNRIYVANDLWITAPRARRKLQTKSNLVLDDRSSTVSRETGETNVSVELNVDGHGEFHGSTGDRMFDHLLAQLARHGLLDIGINVRSDNLPDNHHLVEDVAIVLARALREALREGIGIRRMGSAIIPLDETLASVALDVGGRGYAVIDIQLDGRTVGSLTGELIEHFLERFAIESGISLHATIVKGRDPHHKAEAIFKALARSLRAALERDPRAIAAIPSTKGTVFG